jgi:zinc protease
MKKIAIITSLLFTFMTQAQTDRSQPKPGPAPAINIGKPQRFTMPNGLQVMVVENSKLPRVSYNLTIDNAPFAEGAKKGIDDLTASLIGNGSTKITKDAFNEEVDFMGADINFYSSGAYAAGLSKYAGRILELMAEGILDPNFTQEELDKEKAKMLDGLKSQEKSVSAVAGRVENVLLFGKNHPKGEYLTEQTINAVTLNDVKQYYNTYYLPGNAYLVVIGDVKFKDVKAKVESVFTDWTKGTAPKLSYTDPKNVQYTQINFVDMPNAVQSEISFVNSTNLKMTDPDYFATIVANQIYGGDFNGYLNMNLREKHGWTYGAYSNINASKYIGKFKANGQVRNAVTDSAVVELLNELKRIRKEKVSEEMLKSVKAGYIGKFVMQIQKPETVAGYAIQTETQKLPADFYENYIKNINAVTVDDVMKAANKYFLSDNGRIVVVGKASEVLPGIEKLKIPIFHFDKFGNPVVKQEVKKADASVTVKTVVDKYIAAVGGEKAVRNVKTLAVFSKGSIQGQVLEFTTKSSTEGKYAIDMVLPAMGMKLMKQRVTPSGAFAEQQGQKKNYEGEELKAMQEQAQPFFELSYINNPNVTFAGIEKINEVEAYVLKTAKSKLFYDIKTGYRVAVENEVKQGTQVIKSTILYGDYKDVKGIKVPHKMNLEGGPMPLEFIASEVKINEGVTEEDFK